MTSREIIRKTLEFEYPERIAHTFEPSDIITASPVIHNPDGEWKKGNADEWQRTDEWGNLWGRVDKYSKGEVIRGALENLEDVETFPMPDFSNPGCYEEAEKIFNAHPDRWHNGLIQGATFSMARKIRKLEIYLVDLIKSLELLSILHDRIDEQIKHQIKNVADIGADSIFIEEDWGTQTQTLISPEMWREFFNPRFRNICSYTHSLGLKFFMHSCGKMTDIIPDLIESGVDLFQFDQPGIHGIDLLSQYQEQSKITYWCPVDIQTTLQTKNENAIRNDVNELLQKLWRGRGGFIAGYYTDNESIGLERKWQDIASDEFLKKGKKRIIY